MSSFTSDMLAGPLRLVRTLVRDDTVQATAEVAGRLGVQAGSMLCRLARLDSEGGSPLSIDEVLIHPVLAAGIAPDVAASPSFVLLWRERCRLTLTKTEFEVSVQITAKLPLSCWKSDPLRRCSTAPS